MTQTPRWIAATAMLLAGGFSLATSAIAAPTTGPATDYAQLVGQLGDRDPAVRKQAFSQLATAAEAARPALSEAMHSGRPAVAAAAAELLLRTRWYTLDDPPGVQQRIGRYGLISPARRIGVLNNLATSNDPAFHKAALRVAQQDPVDSVVWGAFSRLSLDDSWDPLLTSQKGMIPSAILIARARGLMLAQSPDYTDRPDAVAADRITNLLELALGQERDHPTADAAQLRWAVKKLTRHYVAADLPAKAAEKWRLLIGRGDANASADTNPNGDSDLQVADDDSDNNNLSGMPPLTPAQQLLSLQAEYGPLPGLDRDLIAAGDENADRVSITLGAIALRTGNPVAGHMLISSALADRNGESDNDHADRLFNVGLMLFSAGVENEAQAAMERIVAMDLPGINRMTDAYLRLSVIYAMQGEHQLAGDSLQRAVDHLPAGNSLQIQHGQRLEPWPHEDVIARIAYYYLLAARKHGNTAQIHEQAQAILSSGSTDSEIFLEVLPTLEDPALNVADKPAVDAYFDRVYTKATERLAQNPDDPMEMNDMAWLCARSGRHLDQAISLASKAVAARPAESAYIDTLAEAKFRSGKPAEALALEQQAVKLLPSNTFMREQVERFKKAAATQPK